MRAMNNVLILDDDASLVNALKRHLSQPGMQVLTATTVGEALSLATMHDFSAAVVDVRLEPEGTGDGIDFARQLRGMNPESRVLFLTGSDNPATHEKVRAHGLEQCAVLSKRNGNAPELLGQFLEEAIDAYTSDRKARQSEANSQAPAVKLDTIDLALYRALAADPELLQTMDWRKFEKLLADILETLEYEVELQQGTKDGGIDIIALKRSTELGDHRYLLQAKRWKNRVGVEPVQRLLFLKGNLGATKCCLATTSTFTRGAWALGSDYRWELELRDYDGIREWLERALRKRLNLPEVDA